MPVTRSTMKRRITYFQAPNAPFEQDQVVLTSKNLVIRDLDAARENRITFGLEDLPEELRDVLKQSHELHLRWATERPYIAIAPFASRVSPGLHVHYTPLKKDLSSEALCSVLHTIFGEKVNCSKPEDSFITPPALSTRFAASASLQYWSRLPSLQALVSFIQNTACRQLKTGSAECHENSNSLLSADAVDIDYNSISSTVTVTGLWASPPSGGWTEDIQKPVSSADKIEFGLLTAEKDAAAPEDVKMGGLLAVVGSDKTLKPTMFSFPSRHHALPATASYTVSFNHPTGLHPTMSISLPSSALERPPAPDGTKCALHTYLTLPSSIFGDQYQLGTTDPLFRELHNLAALHSFSGETDLEAPDWVVQRWGSNWLFELAAPALESSPAVSNWTATIPLHLRYLPPSESGYQTANVPWPVVFWACTMDDGTKMGVNPFDRTNLGWDGLFGPRTMFYQLHPSSDKLVEELEVPVLQLKGGNSIFQARNIELATCAAITLGFLWVLWRLLRVAWSSGIREDKSRSSKESHDKKED
ncbi:hypothetical protein N7495_001095 [Penicillium taxi]|uniref:uncharacterized protein n=1 Tax=Penicillium taxi TaxID=168475 RepID=UPI002545B0C8|nr:uncharacterized protein N7495_001095 [Penicillium taxi]KAJ5908413.1 hypothetical protein N7495_001095 [Penicillium taxi]